MNNELITRPKLEVGQTVTIGAERKNTTYHVTLLPTNFVKIYAPPRTKTVDGKENKGKTTYINILAMSKIEIKTNGRCQMDNEDYPKTIFNLVKHLIDPTIEGE